jgi:DNA-binding transcriptional ArsR family regulator
MNPQRHVIKRQTVEIALGRDIDPWPLQEQVSRWVRGLALAEIDRCCSELSSPDHIHRIERLEVDLGEIQPGDFASGVTPRFAAALRENLAAEIVRLESNTSSQGSSSLTASHLELFSLFVRRGLLPWWANRQLPDLPQSSLDYLLRESPGLLRRLLAELAGENLALKRLTQHFDDQRLAALAALPLPAYPELPALLFPALLDAASRMGRSSVVPKSRLRAQLWQCLLQSAALPDAPDLNPTAFYRSATLRWAERLGLPHAALLGHLSQALSVEESNHSSAELPANAAELTINGVGAAKLALPVKANFDTPSLDSDAPWLPSLADLTATLPEALQNSLAVHLKAVPPSDGIQTGLMEALEQWLGQHEKALPAPSRLRWYALLGKLSASNLHASVEPSPRALGPDRNTLDFNDVDRVYVSNAGLVILWPFLSRFFDRLGLLREGAFVDADCVQRGVALLQYLASEDPNPSEHLLPLNKLLSGMGLDALFCLEPPLTAREMDECDILLNAVIEHARVLNRMSVAGFRGSFLLRQGVLSTRDGAWLLQAERETFDLVLERFPWGINWVKLSWMPLPLRVEW